jgi:hypothetical protein
MRRKLNWQPRSNFRSQPRHGAELLKRVKVDPHRIELANKYFIADLPSALLPATRLHKILDKLEQEQALPELALIYLQQQGLVALQQLARREVSYAIFCEKAAEEKGKREQASAEKQRREEEARQASTAALEAQWESERQRREAERRQRESDPKYIAKIKNRQLREKYGLDDFIEPPCFGRVMEILRRIDAGNRLTADDLLWLKTKGKDYFTEDLQAAFHRLEAAFFSAEYQRTGDPWQAATASGHYRKCDAAQKADALLNSIPAGRVKTPKLKSAICTTHGGVMRDLQRLEEALKFGSQAHALTPKDLRPCTLLGAVNFELGNYELGKDWYAKAEARGASEHSIDAELRSILIRADKGKREEIKAFLLREDPDRYHWVNSFIH